MVPDRNFGWLPTQGHPFGPGHLMCEDTQSFDGRQGCIWHAKEGNLDLSLSGPSGDGLAVENAPTLMGAVYAAIRVKPMQNATELELVTTPLKKSLCSATHLTTVR